MSQGPQLVGERLCGRVRLGGRKVGVAAHRRPGGVITRGHPFDGTQGSSFVFGVERFPNRRNSVAVAKVTGDAADEVVDGAPLVQVLGHD